MFAICPSKYHSYTYRLRSDLFFFLPNRVYYFGHIECATSIDCEHDTNNFESEEMNRCGSDCSNAHTTFNEMTSTTMATNRISVDWPKLKWPNRVDFDATHVARCDQLKLLLTTATRWKKVLSHWMPSHYEKIPLDTQIKWNTIFFVLSRFEKKRVKILLQFLTQRKQYELRKNAINCLIVWLFPYHRSYDAAANINYLILSDSLSQNETIDSRGWHSVRLTSSSL